MSDALGPRGGGTISVRLSCPRCEPAVPEAASYREAAGQGARGRALVQTGHPSGETLHVCSSCDGALVDRAALLAIERWGRQHRDRASAAEIALRAFAPARPDIECPRCGVGMFTRRWGMATLVSVDSCIECGSVWLDGGELAQIEARSL